jgi:DNA polymerase-3 subunit epsilon
MSLPLSLARWWGRGGATARATRWAVVDVETSGLDAHRDRLLAIAAIAVDTAVDTVHDRPRILLGDSFEVVLRQPEDRAAPDKANILLHGIGVGAQRGGVAPAEALQAFERWAADAPLVAFHAAFDETMIQRHALAVLGRRLPNAWVDLAQVAPVVAPTVRARSLDEWLHAYRIECAVRHQAAADTLATAELLLKLWPAIRAEVGGGAVGFEAMRRLAAQARWMPAR